MRVGKVFCQKKLIIVMWKSFKSLHWWLHFQSRHGTTQLTKWGPIWEQCRLEFKDWELNVYKILVFHWWELTHRRNACVCWAVQSSQKWDHCVGIWKQLTVRLQRWRPFWVEQVLARLSLKRLLFSFSSSNLPSHRHCRHLMNNNAFPASPKVTLKWISAGLNLKINQKQRFTFVM